MLPKINMADYRYDLPEERIAKFPLEKRDTSKLLTYLKGAIGALTFADLPLCIPSGSMLVFNETKVIPARLIFCKATGAFIELFCLDPHRPAGYEQNFAATAVCEWKCTVGNSKRWKNDILELPFGKNILQAERVEKQSDCSVVRFSWDGGFSFAHVLEQCGAMPIPPYLKRDAVAEDAWRYQTVYARNNGSVAAPTAGLHFTPEVLEVLSSRGITIEKITLHVGAGTFRPVKAATIEGHTMHYEPFSVSKQTIRHILNHRGPVIAVGTTSTRTLESLYFLGRQCAAGQIPELVTQWEPYTDPCKISKQEAFAALLQYMDSRALESLHAVTRLLIAPPYRFKIVDGLVTNFHQPQSTLLLLVSALIGPDWRNVYDYALGNGFRFLSYGDSSLLLP